MTLQDVATDPVDDKLVLLRGPRRVGKSVLLKDTIAALCRRPDLDARQIIYLPCDGMKALDLNRVEKLGRDLTRSVGDVRRIWLLDEITGIPQWTETVKYLRDNTQFGGDTIICTGSSWDFDGAVEKNLFAGRAGSGSHQRDRLLLPMTFRDALTAWGEQIPSTSPSYIWDLQGVSAQKTLTDLEFTIYELDLRWQAFLTSGGYPRAVAEYHRDGMVSDAVIQDMAAWLHRDVDPDAPEDSIPTLVDEVQRRSTSPLELTNLTEAIGYSKRQAAELRVTRLVRSYAALDCFHVDSLGKRILRTQSKLYLVDPLFAWIPSRLRSGMATPDFTHLTEAAVGVALARAIDKLQPGRWQSRDTIGYSRTRSGNEIDFAPVSVPSGHSPMMTTPIEAKWVATGWREEAKTIESTYQRGVLATRDLLDTTYRAWAIPAPLLVLLLG